MHETIVRKIVREALREVKSGLKDVQQDVTGLKVDVSGLKEDVTDLKEGVTELKRDVTGLKEDVTGLKGDVTELKGDVRHIGLIQEQHTEILAAIGEGIQNLQSLPTKLDEMNNRVVRLEDNADAMKPVIQGHSQDIAGLKSHTGLD